MSRKALLKLPLLLFAIFIGLCSCDSRKSKNDLLKESVTNFKDSVGPIEIAKYFPEKNVIKETDTILNTGFRYRIISSVDMENAILRNISHDTFVEKQHFRKSIVKLQVFSENKLIFDEKIDSTFLHNYNSFTEEIGVDDLIISDLRLDNKSFLNKKLNKIFFRIRAFNPNHKLDKNINLHIDETGAYSMHTTKSYPIKV